MNEFTQTNTPRWSDTPSSAEEDEADEADDEGGRDSKMRGAHDA
jgi:hypothetical protein